MFLCVVGTNFSNVVHNNIADSAKAVSTSDSHHVHPPVSNSQSVGSASGRMASAREEEQLKINKNEWNEFKMFCQFRKEMK
jgi:hypothetical protein